MVVLILLVDEREGPCSVNSHMKYQHASPLNPQETLLNICLSWQESVYLGVSTKEQDHLGEP